MVVNLVPTDPNRVTDLVYENTASKSFQCTCCFLIVLIKKKKKLILYICVCMLTIALCLGLFFVVDVVGVCWGEVVCCITVFFYYVILHLEEEVSTSDGLIDIG